MEFLVIGHATHIISEGKIYSYGPYVREMNLWTKHVDKVKLVVPVQKDEISKIHLPYEHEHIDLLRIPAISITSLGAVLRTFLDMPIIFFRIISAMRKADHIHLRCPGNIGLLGCISQVLFPKKTKTAKYAGNWDPNSRQPWSYKLQKRILSSTFLTRNMQVLVYGDWPKQSKNIKSFFTATYYKHKIPFAGPRKFEKPYKFLFVGSLVIGKQPLYAIRLVERLNEGGHKVTLDLYGDGIERTALEEYVEANSLGAFIHIHGNQSGEAVETAYTESHFLILPSKSEGWPKVVAESMFWGCIPLVTGVSCVPWMLAEGDRGIVISEDLKSDLAKIEGQLQDVKSLEEKSVLAQLWSQQYTLDKFELEIKNLLS